MPKMNVKRLTILRDYLKTLPKSVYNQDSYGYVNDDGKFMGCGFGHATQIPEFRKAGLSGGYGRPPIFKGECCADAMAKFLGIKVAVAEWLSAENYKNPATPTEMIKRLDAVIEDRIEPRANTTDYKIVKKKVLADA